MVEIRILLPSMKIERAKRARETAEGLGGGGGGGGVSPLAGAEQDPGGRRCKLPPMGSGTMF